MADDDYVMLNTTGGSQGGAVGGPKNKLPGFLQKLFGDLTNSQVQIPGQGTVYSRDPSQLAQAASQRLPSTAQMSGSDPLHPSPEFDTTQVPSQIQTPTFQQANQTGGLPGVGGARNPALTTKGKVLATILQIAQGGMAGYAAGQQGNPREGYPNANAGAGFAAGEQLPFLRAYRQQQLDKGLMDNYLTKAELDNLPYQRATALAKLRKDQADAKRAAYQTPKNGGIYNTDTQQYEPGSQPPEKADNLDQMISSRLQDVLRAGSDPG